MPRSPQASTIAGMLRGGRRDDGEIDGVFDLIERRVCFLALHLVALRVDRVNPALETGCQQVLEDDAANGIGPVAGTEQCDAARV